MTGALLRKGFVDQKARHIEAFTFDKYGDISVKLVAPFQRGSLVFKQHVYRSAIEAFAYPYAWCIQCFTQDFPQF